MLTRVQRHLAWFVCIAVLAGGTLLVNAADAPFDKGQRIFTTGHSFHYFVPPILTDLAKSAGIADHTQVGTQAIGGSRVIQHWNVPDDKNKAKQALQEGRIDVFTMSPIYLPDEGIANFAELAVKHNPDIRITVQEFWLPYDVYDPNFLSKRPAPVDRNTRTGEELRKMHAEYFASMDEHVGTLNKQLGKNVLYVVPVGQAVIALREKIIAGEAYGLKKQDDLFSDPLCHATPPLMALNAYCHFAVIYRRTPVGLPFPSVLNRFKNPNWDDKLNRLLQELAWDAVTQHPLSGVTAEVKPN